MVDMYCYGCKKKINNYKSENWYRSVYWCDDCLEIEKKKKIEIVAECSFNDIFDKNFKIPEGGIS